MVREDDLHDFLRGKKRDGEIMDWGTDTRTDKIVQVRTNDGAYHEVSLGNHSRLRRDGVPDRALGEIASWLGYGSAAVLRREILG